MTAASDAVRRRDALLRVRLYWLRAPRLRFALGRALPVLLLVALPNSVTAMWVVAAVYGASISGMFAAGFSLAPWHALGLSLPALGTLVVWYAVAPPRVDDDDCDADTCDADRRR